MKKIPTLFIRKFENHKVISISEEVTPGLEWVLQGEGIATVKIDGSCCAIIDGKFYKRFDAKTAKKGIPEGAIPCCDPDPITGHWPHWVPVKEDDPGSKWFRVAYKNSGEDLENGTYEAIGPHFQGNPHHLEKDILERHGIRVIEDCPRTFEGLKDYLESHYIEGIVFWKDGEPQCKIKRSDFGFDWGKR